jgi:D-sedoheptulose 7-phosphate isomerase
VSDDVKRWADCIDAIAAGLRGMAVTDQSGAGLAAAEGFARWAALTRATHERGGHVYIIGNGGSAAMASNIATDALKGAGLRAIALNDIALVTATANDLSYDRAFALPLERLGRPGDLLISISCSGDSPSIVRALDAAAGLGVAAVTLSGRRADNASRTRGHLNFYVPIDHYGRTESAHQAILHHWLDEYGRTNDAGGAPI